MSGTWNHSKQLRYRVQEVEDLGDEEEQQCLAEMSQDTYHSECHASKIAEGVTHKHTRWVPSAHMWERKGRGERKWREEVEGGEAHQLCLSKAEETAMKGRMR